jgi:hypothetical protein
MFVAAKAPPRSDHGWGVVRSAKAEQVINTASPCDVTPLG